MSCHGCGRPLPAGRADRRFCSAACRQRAYRSRAGAPASASSERRSPRAETIYECPGCGERSLGEQRCPDCNVFCRRVGAGAPCPHCGEPVAVADLLAPA
jgi:hypothetical protein